MTLSLANDGLIFALWINNGLKIGLIRLIIINYILKEMKMRRQLLLIN